MWRLRSHTFGVSACVRTRKRVYARVCLQQLMPPRRITCERVCVHVFARVSVCACVRRMHARAWASPRDCRVPRTRGRVLRELLGCSPVNSVAARPPECIRAHRSVCTKGLCVGANACMHRQPLPHPQQQELQQQQQRRQKQQLPQPRTQPLPRPQHKSLDCLFILSVLSFPFCFLFVTTLWCGSPSDVTLLSASV